MYVFIDVCFHQCMFSSMYAFINGETAYCNISTFLLHIYTWINIHIVYQLNYARCIVIWIFMINYLYIKY